MQLRVKELREEKGWNQTVLGYHSGLSPSQISQIENGKRNPTVDTLEGIANALGVGVGDLFPKARRSSPKAAEDKAGEERRLMIETLEKSHVSYRGPNPARVEGERSPETQAERFLERAEFVEYAASEWRKVFSEIARRDDREERRRLASLFNFAPKGVLEHLDRQGVLRDLHCVRDQIDRGEEVPAALQKAAYKLHNAILDLLQIGPQANQIGATGDLELDSPQRGDVVPLSQKLAEEAEESIEEVYDTQDRANLRNTDSA